MRLRLQAVRRRIKAMLGRDLNVAVEHRCATLRLGSFHAGWTFCPALLRADSIVYSFGVGKDISFDLDLIERFALDVFAFDPTPQSIQWIQTQSLPRNFHLHCYGVASTDGFLRLHSPRNPNFVSHTVIAPRRGETDFIDARVHRFATILEMLKHRQVDLLKMDIEGSEYEVIPDLLAAPTLPVQLLIEFHHRFPGVGPQRTKHALRKIRQAGYKIFAVSPSGEEISLIQLNERSISRP